MASNFYVWTTNFAKRSACSYYRIEVPMNQLTAMDHAQVYTDNGDGREESTIACLYSDIAHWYGIQGSQPLHHIKTLKKIPPGVRDGNDIYPPALIYDTDDNNDFVHPFNTTFASMGVRGYPDARLLKPGEGLEITDHKGNSLGGYVDQETKYDNIPFDVARNLQTMKTRHQIMRECHGVTVPSPTLARYIRDVIGQPNVYVFPNTIVPGHFENIRAVRTGDEVRILWQGGMSHWIDWYPLRDVLKLLSEKYRGKIKWVIFGEWFNWIHENIPDDMVEHHPWVEYDAYKLKRGLLNIDINLCPLANNVFNACKSAIKAYEGTLWEQPEVVLASKTSTYSEIEDGKTGLMYSTPEEFVQQLSTLIEQPELRKRLADAWKEWVFANRTPAATIPGLFDFYAETRARQRRTIGRPVIKRATIEEIKKIATPLR